MRQQSTYRQETNFWIVKCALLSSIVVGAVLITAKFSLILRRLLISWGMLTTGGSGIPVGQAGAYGYLSLGPCVQWVGVLVVLTALGMVVVFRFVTDSNIEAIQSDADEMALAARQAAQLDAQQTQQQLLRSAPERFNPGPYLGY